ncbi:hypothetical protein D9M69_627660 [compost metagenome]
MPSSEALSTQRPVMTMSAPARKASAMGQAPRYALADISGAGAAVAVPAPGVSRNCAPSSSTSSPVTMAIRGESPCSCASASSASRHFAGFRPPALETRRTLRSISARRFGFTAVVMKSVA